MKFTKSAPATPTPQTKATQHATAIAGLGLSKQGKAAVSALLM